jgi:hypothetical protein
VPEPTDDVVDLDNPKPSAQAELPVPLAIEFLGDIAEEEGNKESAIQVSALLNGRTINIIIFVDIQVSGYQT